MNKICAYSKCDYEIKEDGMGFETAIKDTVACSIRHSILYEQENDIYTRSECDGCKNLIWVGDLKDHYPDGTYCEDCWNPQWKDWSDMKADDVIDAVRDHMNKNTISI